MITPRLHLASMDYMEIPIEPGRPRHIEVDPSLRTITRGVSYQDAFDMPVPHVRAITQVNLDNFERNAVSHVVIQQAINPSETT